jgi:unsaturated chondroitin disaccharide hydrolase
MDYQWISGFWNRIENKLQVIAPQVSTRFPYTTDQNGNYVPFMDNQWWTNGFWGGMMWLAYLGSNREIYRQIAIRCEEELDQAFLDFNGLHHDVGFMWLPTAVAHYRIDGDTKAKTRGMHAATILAGRFNVAGNFIRAWNGNQTGWAIIDCMMNIPLLYWASEQTNDPRFRFIAMRHADTVMEHFVRADGSVNHIVCFDPVTGAVLDKPRGQGYASGSSWTRGQAWAIYGFALSYLHTGKEEYLQTAKAVAKYFIENLSQDGVPVVDFRAPETPVLKDTTAGAIAACGMIELMKLSQGEERALYESTVEKMLKGLQSNCDFTLENQSILQNGTERYHDTRGFHIPIIYGDYYLMEALLKLKGNETLFW